jgi:leucyl aminopeptidase
MTPTILADEAAKLAEAYGLEIEVLEKHQMAAMGMNAILAVASGSAQPPKLIILRYKGDPDSDQTIGLVGKGITFDTGGISIKPAQNMDHMKGDMGGAAAVIAAMGAIAQLKPKINVTALCPCTENMPSGSAYKPGDVIKAYNGKTIEVINTDAEGRVVLSDAVAYATELGCSPIIDIATLTGAISITLGDVCAGIMGTNQQLIDEIMFAGQRAGERFWQLPLYPEYEELIKGSTGDWLNSGGREAGSITGACFIRQFTDDRPWVHLDIAGVDWSSKDKGVTNKGCTGWGARALTNFVLARAGAI